MTTDMGDNTHEDQEACVDQQSIIEQLTRAIDEALAMVDCHCTSERMGRSTTSEPSDVRITGSEPPSVAAASPAAEHGSTAAMKGQPTLPSQQWFSLSSTMTTRTYQRHGARDVDCELADQPKL